MKFTISQTSNTLRNRPTHPGIFTPQGESIFWHEAIRLKNKYNKRLCSFKEVTTLEKPWWNKYRFSSVHQWRVLKISKLRNIITNTITVNIPDLLTYLFQRAVRFDWKCDWVGHSMIFTIKADLTVLFDNWIWKSEVQGWGVNRLLRLEPQTKSGEKEKFNAIIWMSHGLTNYN